MGRIYLSFVFWIFLAYCGFTQSDSLFQTSVQRLLSLPVVQDLNAASVSLATKSQTAVEETPAVISLITELDIVRWGCRDMSDVLRMVPGFEFGIDVQSLYGLGFRGIWAHEGKALLMLNGTPINCFGYGNYNFIGTLPATIIERVEIIRGPGSALYGGFAEVAVINIITKTQESSFTSFGGLIGREASYGGNLSIALQKNEEVRLAVHLGAQSSPISSRHYEDFFGNSYTMGRQNSWRNWSHILIQGQFKRLSLSYNRTKMDFNARDAFSIALPDTTASNLNQLNNFTDNLWLKYDFPIGKKLVLQPSVMLSRGNTISTITAPASYVNAQGVSTYYSSSSNWENNKAIGGRYTAELNAFYKGKDDDVVVGVGYQLNTYTGSTLDGTYSFQAGSHLADTTQELRRGASFALVQYIRKIGNIRLTLGSRYDLTPFGTAFSPRVGITYNYRNFYSKLLYGRAFRAPTLWQAFSRQFTSQAQPNSLVPEITNTVEIEMGYKFSETLRASANAFWIAIDQPITYIGADNSYQNFGKISSLGLEAEVYWRKPNYGGFVNGSFCMPTKNTIQAFVNEDKTHFLALPDMKWNAGAYYRYKKITLAPTLTYLGQRYGQSVFSARNSAQETIYDTQIYAAAWLVNTNIMCQNLIRNLDVSLRCHNLLNTPFLVIQPYYGSHAPMPVNDRQISLYLSYRW